jgi:hypothetical protein
MHDQLIVVSADDQATKDHTIIWPYARKIKSWKKAHFQAL